MRMKGLTEKNLEKIFMVRMGEFYGNKDIRLMEKNGIDDLQVGGCASTRTVMEKINRNPIKWVKSLNTFDKYEFFIDCDIIAPT